MVEDKILDYHSPNGNKFLIISMYNWRTTTDEIGIFEAHTTSDDYLLLANIGSQTECIQYPVPFIF